MCLVPEVWVAVCLMSYSVSAALAFAVLNSTNYGNEMQKGRYFKTYFKEKTDDNIISLGTKRKPQNGY